MPSQHQSAATTDRETFDDPHKDEAARFLDTKLVETGAKHTSMSGRDLFVARVRGIDSLGVVNAWIQVERDLDCGPRDKVMNLLERRRDYLIEHGDRDDRVDVRTEPRDLPPAETRWTDRPDVEEPGDRAVYMASSANLREERPELFEDDQATHDVGGKASVATDGGQEREGSR